MKPLLCETCRKEITKNKRTIQQNRYFYAIIKIISESLGEGYTPHQVKLLIKDQFLMYEDFVNKKTGEVIRDYHSTANLSRKEFSELTEKLRLFCESYGLVIQTPEEFFQT